MQMKQFFVLYANKFKTNKATKGNKTFVCISVLYC